LEIRLNRAVVHQVIGELKTEASQKPLPLDPKIARALRDWRRMLPFDQQTEWVFACPEMRGQQPYWPENLCADTSDQPQSDAESARRLAAMQPHENNRLTSMLHSVIY
jgi:hypothetical protein